MFSRFLDNSSFNLTTAGTAVTAPTDLDMNCSGMSVCARATAGGTPVEWSFTAPGGTTSKTMPDYEIGYAISANPGQTIFTAKVASGTAVLEVGWLG